MNSLKGKNLINKLGHRNTTYFIIKIDLTSSLSISMKRKNILNNKNKNYINKKKKHYI